MSRTNTPGASDPPPDAPPGLIATVASGQVTLSWGTTSSVSAITKFQFRQREVPEREESDTTWNPDWGDIPLSTATTKRFIISSLKNGTTYTFELRAVSANGNGAASRIDAATPGAPPKPTGFEPTNVPGTGQTYAVSGSKIVIEFDWEDPPADGTQPDYWEYRYRASGETDWGNWRDAADYIAESRINWPGSETSANLGGVGVLEGELVPLDAGTLYEFQLRAVAVDDTTGEITGKSEPSNSAFAYTAFPAAPSAPANLQAADSVGGVILTWDDRSDASIHTYRYQITQTGDSVDTADFTSATWVAFAYSTDETTATGTISNLAPGTYYFKIQAANNGGDSGDSNVASGDSRAASAIWRLGITPFQSSMDEAIGLAPGGSNGLGLAYLMWFGVALEDRDEVVTTSVEVSPGAQITAAIELNDEAIDDGTIGFGDGPDAVLSATAQITLPTEPMCSFNILGRGVIRCFVYFTQEDTEGLYATADANPGAYKAVATANSAFTVTVIVNGVEAVTGIVNEEEVTEVEVAEGTSYEIDVPVGSIEPPSVVAPISSRRLLIGSDPAVIPNIDQSFSHPDELTITAASDDETVVRAEIFDGSVNLRLIPVGLGEANITVSARTPAFVFASFSFQVRITDRDPTVWRIEPAITSVTLRGGEKVRLSVDVYGIQDILDADIVDDDEDVAVEWTDDPGGGNFAKQGGRTALYTAPNSPGSHEVTATVADGGCFPAEGEGDDIETDKEVAARCAASFEIVVRRASATGPADAAPVNPSGPIPSLLTDTSGTAHSVFTPEEGGDFAGDGFGISAGPGAVPNGEILGISMSAGDDAYNVGSTHQRYTLMGDSYDINLVNSSGAGISSYRLDSYAVACVPLPDSLRSDITNVGLTAINEDGSLTILTSNVRLAGAGLEVCGRVSSLPATIAVGTSGAPPDFPPQPTEPDVESPDTGGTAPTPWSLLLMLMLGSALVLAPTALRRRWAARSIR